MSQGARTPTSQSETCQRVHKILRGYLSELTTGSLLDSTLERAALSATRLQPSELPALLPLLERGARLFMRNQSDAEAALVELRKLVTEAPPGGSRRPVDWPPEAPTSRRPLESIPEAPTSRRPLESVSEASTSRQPGGWSSEAPTSRQPGGWSSEAPSARRSVPDLGVAPQGRASQPTPRERSSDRDNPKGEVAPEQGPPQVIEIAREDDIMRARVEARRLGERLGASLTVQTHLATLVSELARNIVLYAGGRGVIELSPLARPLRGVSVVARDEGPGIADISLVLDGNYRSKQGMGLGLRGVRKLSHFFELRSVVGSGTTVRAQLRVG